METTKTILGHIGCIVVCYGVFVLRIRDNVILSQQTAGMYMGIMARLWVVVGLFLVTAACGNGNTHLQSSVCCIPMLPKVGFRFRYTFSLSLFCCAMAEML